MAEFCLECWNRINEISLTEKNVVLSHEYEICEGCGKYKPVVLKLSSNYYFRRIFYDK